MSSNYQMTCYNIAVDGNVLSATCKRRDGSWKDSSVVLKGIENIDGTLRVTDSTKDSNFNLSSNNVVAHGDIITATCQKRDGSWNNSLITLNGIENIDGSLKYTGNP